MGRTALHRMRHRTYTAAGVILAAGLTLVARGLAHNATPETLVGVVLCISAQMLGCMRLIYWWVTNTAVLRTALLASKQHHDEEAAKYSAGLLANAAEQDRTRRALLEGARRLDQTLKVERAALEAEFEEKRADLVSRTMETTLRLARAGEFDETAVRERARERVIVPFPTQPADYERARGRDVIP